MRIKKEKYKDLRTDNEFWYDLTDGGYIDPDDLLEDKQDALKVMAAIKIVKEFEDAYNAACDELMEDEDED